MSRALPPIRIAVSLASVAVVAAGCSAISQSSSQGEQSYKTMYGLSSEGTTTDLYTEIFGPRRPPPAPSTAVAATEAAQPIASQPIAPVQQTTMQPTATAGRPARAAATTTPTAANRTPQPVAPQPAPVQVAQQPVSPPVPPEPDVPTAYGITASGPTTDLYTEIFGPRRSAGQ